MCLSLSVCVLVEAGKTALHMAATNGQTDVIDLLLNHSANVDESDSVNQPFILLILLIFIDFIDHYSTFSRVSDCNYCSLIRVYILVSQTVFYQLTHQCAF